MSKKIAGYPIVLLVVVGMLVGCTSPQEAPEVLTPAESVQTAPTVPIEEKEDEEMLAISILVGDVALDAQLHNNASTQALVAQMPLTLEMADYAGQEKVVALPFDLPPAETEQPDTIYAGEIFLWSGNQLVLFYTSFPNSYGGYVRLGRVEGKADHFAKVLGDGNITATLTLANTE